MAEVFTDAKAQIAALLTERGLAPLIEWAWAQIVEGRSVAEIELNMRETQAFRTRFSAIFEREKKGLPPLSVAEYLSFEAQMSQMARAMGMPAGFMNRDFTNRLLANDVSAVEAQDRMQSFVVAAFQTPPEVRSQLRQLYGVDEGGLAAYFMDPDRGLQVLQRQFVSSQIAGSSQRQGFGQLTREEAEGLSGTLSPEQADDAFGALVEGRELFEALPGAAESQISRQSQLAFATGQTEAVQQVRKRGRERESVFRAGGGFAAGQEGVSGLGTAGY